ncbi:hypothetical protein ABW42_00675 [Stenotrophomonas maltophilia]|nr:hypothetical protein ABW42_00675 [Stenotrophomonas maltophilia]
MNEGGHGQVGGGQHALQLCSLVPEASVQDRQWRADTIGDAGLGKPCGQFWVVERNDQIVSRLLQ